MNSTWLYDLLPLQRPEYANQVEALLTDLLWRSPGSSLSSLTSAKSAMDFLAALNREALPPPNRLVPSTTKRSNNAVVETLPFAQLTDLTGIVDLRPGDPNPVPAFLNSIMAPKAAGSRSTACVPLHGDAAALQTLHGLVNKKAPPALGSIIETVGVLGGSGANGRVASSFIGALASSDSPTDGLTGFTNQVVPAIAATTWAGLRTLGTFREDWPAWAGVKPLKPAESAPSTPVAKLERTPFRWFWNKWQVLCDPAVGWVDKLPARRFADWASCILRTALAFSYIWEAEFFTRVHQAVVAKHRMHGADPYTDLRLMLQDGAVLASLQPSAVPASQKEAWRPMSALLSRGGEVRRLLEDYLTPGEAAPTGATAFEMMKSWIESLAAVDLNHLAQKPEVGTASAKNQKEFVRYLLLPRSSDVDTVDQADYYYLMRRNSSNSWLSPGPEWIVVIASLVAGRPGGQCTLGMLSEDLGNLGIRTERAILVALLEEAGLTTDSPDADSALIIQAGF